MKDLLHVIVGAGVPDYFANCLDSVSRNSSHDVLGYYNWVNDRDLHAASEIARKKKSEHVEILLQRNLEGRRTGSLYDAYNRAIDRALGKYRYISFIQADMQMMWWNDRIIEACDSIVESFQEENAGSLCFFSQIPVQGKREDYYSNWRDKDGELILSQPGAADVAIYALNPIFARGFRFGGSEEDFSALCAKRGVRLCLLPYPFLAPIPFPKTVREGTRPVSKSGEELPEMVLSPLGKELANFERETFHPLFMEDVVWPNGWRVLTPYWPSDTLGTEWLRIRFRQARERRFSFLKTQSGDKAYPLPLGRFRPGYLAIISSGVRLFLREAKRRFRLSNPSHSGSTRRLKLRDDLQTDPADRSSQTRQG